MSGKSDKGKQKAIIVGAGIGGTATAARLAHAGFDVEVYEKNEFSGGRCSLIKHDGYRFDLGPSLLLLPPLFHELYKDLGTTLSDHIDLIQCNPNYVIHYHDGSSVTLSSDRAQLGAEVEKWEGEGGASRLEGFLAEARKHAELSYSLVLSQTFPSLLSLLRPSFLSNVIALHPFVSLYSRCAKYFKTERMRRAFSFGSMYLGSSPFDSPGTYSLLQWTETCEGIWYPKGGFHQVPASLQKIAKSHGAKFHFNSPIKQVMYDDTSKKATGVQLENGKVMQADVVVVNADLVWAYNNLFTKEGGKQARSKVEVNGDAHVGNGNENGHANGQNGKDEVGDLLSPTRAKSLLAKPHSCSSISFYWALNQKIPSLNAHNIFLAKDYKTSFDQIFKERSMPTEPSFYVNVPSRIDPSAAPDGKDAVVVLVPVGHLIEGKKIGVDGQTESQDWDKLVERAKKQIIGCIEERLGIEGFREMITWEHVNTPLTWKDKFNLTHGSILGITHDFFNVLAFRHQARHPDLKGAYFVGASAHPGTGVPIAIAGSKLCAKAIMDDLSIPHPETYAKLPPKSISELDKHQSPYLSHYLADLFSVSYPYVVGIILGILILLVWLVLNDVVDLKSLISLNGSFSHFPYLRL